MSSSNYKQLIAYMPTMAAVVNSFQSPEVQLVAFQRLIDALEDALQIRPAGDAARPPRAVNGSAAPRSTSSVSAGPEMEIAHDLVDGDSIHSAIGE